MEGLTLKNWKVGKKLGEGACSEVYAVEPLAALNDKKCSSFVMKVSPLVSLPPSKTKNKKRKKSAAERNADALYAEHLMYQSHLRDYPGLPYIPAGAYGEDKGYRFLVMERLGRTLEDVLRDQGPVSSQAAAQLGFNILDTFQHIHAKNIVYVDVKPENFMLDTRDESEIYCVDFGIADRYIMATGKHKDFKVGSVVGTPTFLSVNCHGGATASRRDDVEALLHVLIYMMRGDLPWQNATSDEAGEKIKKQTAVHELCDSLPSEWAQMLTMARECEFEDKPDYDAYARLFVKLGAEKHGSKRPFQWGKASSKTTAKKSSPSPKKSRQTAKEPAADRTAARNGRIPTTETVKKAVDRTTPAVADRKATVAAVARKPKITRVTQSRQPVKKRAVSEESESEGESDHQPGDEKDEGSDDGYDDDNQSEGEGGKEEAEEEEEDSGDEDADPEDSRRRVANSKPSARDPQRRRKAAAQAVAAAAAAAAAANQAAGTGRYNLRSGAAS